MDQPLWRPDQARIARTNMVEFMAAVEEDWNLDIPDFDALHAFSIGDKEKFWQSLRDYAGIIAETWGEVVLADGERMPGARWFPDARLNFAENLMRRRDDGDALVFRGEDKVERRLSHAELYDQVSRLAQALRRSGIEAGDRIAAYLPNLPEAITGMLGATSFGAVWSSCSPDFGVQGVIDRFGQIEPRVLFAADGYHYNGKTHDSLAKLADIMDRLPSVEKLVIVPYTRSEPDLSGLPRAVLLADFTAGLAPGDIDFVRLPFDHPLYIMYSSGTTGAPKCIVHGVGGALFQHAKEHLLHCDIKPGDRVFYFTTCGWMMWNWLASALAAQATLLLYDGSPFYPGPEVLFDFADDEAMTLFGTSAKFIDALAKAGAEPIRSHRLDTVRMMASTGSPLAPESFDYVYRSIKTDIHLASIAGGTDILGCFVCGDPTGPVWRGEIQAPALAMEVDVFDDHGNSLRGVKGELVCKSTFPSMPIHFWNDGDGAKYHAAYFDRYPGVWHHGDYVEYTEHGGIIMFGRSDATLNPGGVRIGTAEIYRQVERLDEVLESIVIGQEWDNDVRVVLFVILRQGLDLDDALRDKVRKHIRATCTPRHVPAKVIQVADIPRTKNGKITELAVRDTVHGRPVKNREALANPEALDLYVDLPELRE